MVEKTIRYEATPTLDEWRRRVLLLSGNGSFFEQSSDHLSDQMVPGTFDVERLDTRSTSPYVGSTSDVVRLFDRGMAVVNFVGHGGGNVWSDAGLFLLDDVPLLNNGDRLPLVFSLTCFTGLFDNPEEISALGEALIKIPGKGAIGVTEPL